MGRLIDRIRAVTLASAIGAVIALSLAPATVLAAGIEFGTPTATPHYGQGIDFSVTLDLDAPVDRVELLLRFPNAPGPLVVEVAPPSGTGRVTLSHSFSVAEEGHLLPNTTIESSWRARAAAPLEAVVTSPVTTVTYADDRYDWKTVSGDIVRVHWTQGDQAFGERALTIGEAGVERAEQLLGVSETEPVDFFVYADQQAFYDALGPGTRENVGGQANADIRTLFALITPSDIDDAWVGIVIPHELTHLVFDTAVENPYHFPPRWLNEGLAVYLSEGYGERDRRAVLGAAESGRLIPLAGLVGQFPTTSAGFFLAYSESVSALEFMVRKYGQDAVVALISSYAEGRTDDEAFSDALGVDTAAFDAAWFADVKGTLPAKVGPNPDPAGPVPQGWEGAAPTGAPVASPATSAAPAPSGAAGTRPGNVFGLILIVFAVLIGAFLLLRQRRSRDVIGVEAAPPVTATPGPPAASHDPDP